MLSHCEAAVAAEAIPARIRRGDGFPHVLLATTAMMSLRGTQRRSNPHPREEIAFPTLRSTTLCSTTLRSWQAWQAWQAK